jgi:molybdate transport system substrate-binding protein
MPEEISLLSTGAVKPGLLKVLDTFQRDCGHLVRSQFATAPAFVKRFTDSEAVDAVIAPPAVLDKLAAMGSIAAEPATIGRIGVGVMVREGSTQPKIATVEDLKQSLLDADSLVYNQASTGIYLDALFVRLGIRAQVESKSTRHPDFAGVLDHMMKGKSGEIAFGATTVIAENARNGLQFAGPLPDEIQNYTLYKAALTTRGVSNSIARQFFSYLVSPLSKSLFAAAGMS